MALHSLKNIQFGKITGFNSFKDRQAMLQPGFQLYNRSIYQFNPRNFGGSRFFAQGSLGTYVQYSAIEASNSNNQGSLWSKIKDGVVGVFRDIGKCFGYVGKWIGGLFK